MGKTGIGTATACCAALGALAACGTSYKVSNVKMLYPTTNESGLYYYLPKTMVNVEAVAKSTARTYGPYYKGSEDIPGPVAKVIVKGVTYEANTFAELNLHNKTQCEMYLADEDSTGGIEALAKVILPKDENLKEAKKGFEFVEFAVSTEAIPDPSHLYRLNIDRSALASFSHSITINEKGIITAANSTVSDAAAPFTYSVISSTVKLITAGRASDSAKFCQNRKDGLEKLADFKTKLQTLQQKRADHLSRDLADIDGDVFAAVLKDIDAEITKLKADNKATTALFGALNSEQNYVVVWRLEPEKPETYESDKGSPTYHALKFEPGEDDKPKKRVSYLPGTAVTALRPIEPNSDLTDLVGKVQFQFTDDPALTVDKTPAPASTKISPYATNGRNGINARRAWKAKDAKGDTGGYVYRIPSSSMLTIVSKDGAEETPLGYANLNVAQFGALVTLPSEFNGSKSTLDLAFNPNTGAYTKATVAVEPISVTSGSQYLDLAAEYGTAEAARKKAEEDEAKADAEKLERAELDAKLKEIEELEADVKLRNLRTELGIAEEE